MYYIVVSSSHHWGSLHVLDRHAFFLIRFTRHSKELSDTYRTRSVG